MEVGRRATGDAGEATAVVVEGARGEQATGTEAAPMLLLVEATQHRGRDGGRAAAAAQELGMASAAAQVAVPSGGSSGSPF